jgi:hypothetical protein
LLDAVEIAVRLAHHLLDEASVNGGWSLHGPAPEN